jgi:hypothetical protein
MSTTITLTQPIKQPDIQYTPDVQKWRARTQRRLGAETVPNNLPDGFPRRLISDLVWEGSQIEGSYDWTYELNETEVEEIEKGLEYFKCIYSPFIVTSALNLPRS